MGSVLQAVGLALLVGWGELYFLILGKIYEWPEMGGGSRPNVACQRSTQAVNRQKEAFSERTEKKGGKPSKGTNYSKPYQLKG